MREVDNGGGAGHGHIPAKAEDCFPVRPVNPGKWDLSVLDSMRKTLFKQTAAHFAKTATPPDLLLNPHFTMTMIILWSITRSQAVATVA